MLLSKFQELITYPMRKWEEPASGRWVSLCAQMRDYQAPCKKAVMVSERKWEISSALQKSIRRGDKKMAVDLVSAIGFMSDEYAYFWRRFCVIACEDVGPADDVLAAFVIACSTIFSPKKTDHENYDLLCFLAEQMCDLPMRSRIYCSYSIIETVASKFVLPDLSEEDEQILWRIMFRKPTTQNTNRLWQQWQRENDWRTERLLKFVGLTLDLEMTRVKAPIPKHTMLYSLPSYSYDVHTRVGLEMLKRLVRGVQGAEAIRDFFKRNCVRPAHRALGYALFFVEGGRIHCELIYTPLCSLEQRLTAHTYGLPLNDWLHLQMLVREALESGIVDRVRQDVLSECYCGAPVMEHRSLFSLDSQ